MARLHDTLKLSLDFTGAVVPARYGGLGKHRCREIDMVAFLVSAHGSSGFVTRILSVNDDHNRIPFVPEAPTRSTICPGDERPDIVVVQRG